MLNVKDFKVDKVYWLLICYFNIELIIVFVIGKILKREIECWYCSDLEIFDISFGCRWMCNVWMIKEWSILSVVYKRCEN